MNKKYPIMGECTDFSIKEQSDGGLKINIYAPKRFANLVHHKLMELKTSDEEIAYYENGSLSENLNED
ncbi:hypothetical protein KJ742_02110 [Patescibacteria group bacterium]|nr:hypothetical protein [Patescibacteria group bacterium]